MRQDKRRRDIKSKLIAAICMLLVSTIMMVSTTYAWFTLSTAPEVTGISTSVGANGNLEMVLLGTMNSFTKTDDIESGTSDSFEAADQTKVDANQTWGNLVDLSDSSYGLDSIVLLPAALNSDDGSSLGDVLLKTPAYGADGRVSELKKGTITAPYNTSTKSFTEVDNTASTYDPAKTIEYGVRAIGNASSMTVYKTAYTSALSQAGSLASSARTAAGKTLNTYGSYLANMAASSATGASITQTDVEGLGKMIDALIGYDIVTTNDDGSVTTTHVTGVLEIIAESLGYYYAADFASAANTDAYTSDDAFTAALEAASEAFADDLEDDGKINTVTAKNTELNTAFVNTALNTAFAEFNTLVEEVKAAKSKFDSIDQSDSSYNWSDVAPTVNALMNSDTMKICGLTKSQLKDENGNLDTSALMKAYGDYGNNVVVEIVVSDANNETACVYEDLADLVGAFTGSIQLEVPNMGKMTANLQAVPSVTPAELTAAHTQINSTGEKADESDGALTITDKYGYVIDMAFRTNATGSNLLLQTAEAQRIATSSNPTTQGAGSYMEFEALDENFTADQMTDLMENIVVVFYEYGETSNNIIATAKLDVDNAEINEAGIASVKANLYLVDDEDEFIDTQSEAVLCALDANTAKKISALVYLNGETITNGDVATGTMSMTGSLNLQFASSANLVPMNYSELYNVATGETTATEASTESSEATGD